MIETYIVSVICHSNYSAAVQSSVFHVTENFLVMWCQMVSLLQSRCWDAQCLRKTLWDLINSQFYIIKRNDDDITNMNVSYFLVC